MSGDWAFSSVFAATGILFGGQMSSQMVVVNGESAVRPMMPITLCSDHSVWDGRRVMRFLAVVKAELEAQ